MTTIIVAAIAVSAPFTVLAIGMGISMLVAPWMAEERRDSLDASAHNLIALAAAMRSGGRDGSTPTRHDGPDPATLARLPAQSHKSVPQSPSDAA